MFFVRNVKTLVEAEIQFIVGFASQCKDWVIGGPVDHVQLIWTCDFRILAVVGLLSYKYTVGVA